MNPFDARETRAVWSRVMAAAEAPAVRGTEEPVMPARCMTELLKIIEDERHDHCTYQALAKRLSGCDRSMALEMARDEACHAKKLSAAYFLATGEKPCPGRIAPVCIRCVTDTLRERHQEELAAAAHYAEIAKSNPAHSVFEDLARDEARHAEAVRCILERMM